MHPDGRPTSYKPEYRKLAHKYCLLIATNEDLSTFFKVMRPQHRMPREDRYHRVTFSARHPGLHLLAAQPAVPELEPQGRGLQTNPRHRSLIKDSPSHKWRSRLSSWVAFIAHALLRWACTRRALLRHWPRSRMTMLYPRQRRPEFCHPEFSSGLRRGFPTIAERMKIHLTTTRNVAD
jgi:hypothetical protein